VALQSIVENFNPPGLRNYWKNSYLSDLSEDATDLMIERFRALPAPHSHIVLYTLSGAVNCADPEATAVACRDARHVFLIVGMWSDPGADGKNIQQVRDFSTAMRPFCTSGSYLNYEAELNPEQIQSAFSPGKYKRLVDLKNKYDPRNVFRGNQNIRPDAPNWLRTGL
jgi:hypothetical protein